LQALQRGHSTSTVAGVPLATSPGWVAVTGEYSHVAGDMHVRSPGDHTQSITVQIARRDSNHLELGRLNDVALSEFPEIGLRPINLVFSVDHKTSC
jgi:hypothetical protein